MTLEERLAQLNEIGERLKVRGTQIEGLLNLLDRLRKEIDADTALIQALGDDDSPLSKTVVM